MQASLSPDVYVRAVEKGCGSPPSDQTVRRLLKHYP